MSWNLQIGPLSVAEISAAIEHEMSLAEGQARGALEAAKALIGAGHVGDHHVQVTVYGQEAPEDAKGGDSHVHVTVASFPTPGANLPVEVSGPIVAEGSEPPPDSPPSVVPAPESPAPEVPSPDSAPPADGDGGILSAAPVEGSDAAADPGTPEVPAQ